MGLEFCKALSTAPEKPSRNLGSRASNPSKRKLRDHVVFLMFSMKGNERLRRRLFQIEFLQQRDRERERGR